MDPYLDAHWRDIHAGLIIYSRDALQGVLPRSLRARVEESVLLETLERIADHPLYPDVRVVEYVSPQGVRTRSEVGVAVAEPRVIRFPPEPATEKYLEIIDRESGNRVVTVIEFLSPSNKTPGPNRDQYRRKQRDVCSSEANLVEIDLIRAGVHTLAFPLDYLEAPRLPAYLACVRRATQHDTAEIYSMPLQERLPILRIPLRPTDADIPLDLQVLIAQCYRNGAYEDTLSYRADVDPPLREGDKDWADQWLIEKGMRPPSPPRRNGKGKKHKGK